MLRNSRRKKIKKSQKQLENARGRVYYGMHFYPGICEYRPEGKRPFRVFLNEDTIRKMDASFAGRPVYVHHPDDPISQDLDVVRGEADGWVVRSFYNEKDGKHWTQFIIVTDAGELAVRRGWKLSNCYEALRFGSSGSWNGMDYDKQVVEGEYEHLAIVPDPRYEESIILTPEEFKQYNLDKDMELKRLANSKERKKMGFKLFTRRLLDESKVLKNAYVMLSNGREVSVKQLVAEADKADKKGKLVVNSKTKVKFENEEITLGDLMAAHSEALDEIYELKAQLKNAKKKNGGYKANEVDEDELENADDEDDDELENEADEEDDDGDDKDEKKSKNKKAKNSRRSDELDSDDDFEDGIFENDSDEDDEDDGDDEAEEPKSSRRVSNRKEEIDEDDGDDDDQVDELAERRQRNSRRREKAKKLQKNTKKKKSDKKKADKLRNAHNKAHEGDGRYGDGLDPLQRGQAMFGSAQAK